MCAIINIPDANAEAAASQTAIIQISRSRYHVIIANHIIAYTYDSYEYIMQRWEGAQS